MSASAELRGKLAARMVEDLYEAAEDLLGKAVALAPVAEGTLRASGTVALTLNGRRFEGAGALAAVREVARQMARAGDQVKVEAEVVFPQVYAARQHEETGWKHPKGGQAKYLSTPLAANASRYGELLELGQRVTIKRHGNI